MSQNIRCQTGKEDRQICYPPRLDKSLTFVILLAPPTPYLPRRRDSAERESASGVIYSQGCFHLA